jgi:hypothetical protein
MPSPLLSATALFVSAAIAEPPVDAQRVTGNVSTNHARPVVDSCRVTGNIGFGDAMSKRRPDPVCFVQIEAASHTLPLVFVQQEGATCSAEGVIVRSEGVQRCEFTAGEQKTSLPYPQRVL